ncbi:MAG: hypothetical protein WC307_02780 [Candidatus Nanoarchaeia archaeon]|jgi:hypothetical protein
MELKLKDEITRILIESPGSSVSSIAKQTKNYYSYTHKLLSKMEREGLIKIERDANNTKCFINNDYKKEWLADLKRVINSLSKDVEVKAAVAIMYVTILILVISPMFTATEQRLMAFEIGTDYNTPVIEFNWAWIILIIIPLLLIINYLRVKKHY